jgi:hypothetical protein
MKGRTPTWEEWQRVHTEILLDKYRQRVYGWGENSGKCNLAELHKYRKRKSDILKEAESRGIWVMDLMEHLLRLESHYTKKQLQYFHSNTNSYTHRPRKYYTVRHGVVIE